MPSHLICLLSSLCVYDIDSAQMNAFKESCYFLNNNPIRNMARTIIGTVPLQILCSNTVEPLGTDTSPVRTVSKVPTKFSDFLSKNLYGLSLIRTTDTKSRPQRVNSYKLIITSLLHTLRWSGESRIPIRWICTGWIQYGCKVISKAQSLHIKQEFAKGVFRNITEFFKAWITTDSIKIFSMAFCALVTVYCTCKTAKDAFRIVLYVTTLYMQHCAAARQL